MKVNNIFTVNFIFRHLKANKYMANYRGVKHVNKNGNVDLTHNMI